MAWLPSDHEPHMSYVCDIKYVAGGVPTTQKTSYGGIPLGWLNLSIFKRQRVPVSLEMYCLLASFFLLFLSTWGLHIKFLFLSLSFGPFIWLSYQPIRALTSWGEWKERNPEAGPPAPLPVIDLSNGIYWTLTYASLPWSLNLLLRNLRP